MDSELKSILQSIIMAIIYLFLFLILMPVLMNHLNYKWGQVLYWSLVGGAVFVAFRLRFIARHL